MNGIPRRIKKIGAFAALAAALLCPAKGSAASFFYHFSNVFYGATPSGLAPWMDVSFTDTSPGTVSMKISAVGLTDNEYLGALYLNLNPNLTPGNLAFSVVNSSGGFVNPTISTGKDKFKADGDGKYDILFTFNQKAGKTFTDDESITYQITTSSGTLMAMDFGFLSKPAGGSGPFLAAVEIQGICNNQNGWVAPYKLTVVPEPPPGLLLALAISLVSGGRWLMLRKRKS